MVTLPLQPAASSSLRKRMWKGTGLISIFLLTLIIGNFFVSQDRALTRQMLGHDFLAFYWGGHCARTGQYDKLYDLDATEKFERSTGAAASLELGKSFGPWWNPPFAAWMFAPLSALSYPAALTVWWGIGLSAFVVSVVLLCRMLPPDWRTWALVPILMLGSMPFFQAFSHGQNTFISLLLLTIVVTLWRKQQALAAGLVTGLMFYKPQLGAVIALVLVFSQGRRALLGVAITGTALLLINIITLPGTLNEFFFHMPANLRWMQETHNYLWERHITFKAFWRLLLNRGASPTSLLAKSLWGACEIALLAGLALAARATWKAGTDSARDRLIAATIICMPLLMPFYFDYDLLLMAVPAVLYAVDRMRDPAGLTTEDRWLPRAWVVLFLVLEIGPALAGNTHVHCSVLMMTIVGVLLIRRAIKSRLATASVKQPENLPGLLAA